ncbi:cysteine desulfurase CsdA [Vibrio sp. SCSIO 43137]|uniref:cysteine desulfurase CsdA n=1 Tax=Vibrio sp. SCSIO 43137 TaxID=3021011 RepID=UPI0023075D6D|nr:cysteine desulfurase CsdA [Vibrio sp. SCSIO 43137]WCE29083.1 cysteine desulfurase CsdA [Vibrio sp. SCSIO 43137]
MLDINSVRAQFPALSSQATGQLVYLDSAATTQKPEAVINTIQNYYRSHNANVHRGSHSLTAQATSQFESARETVRRFIGASDSKEIIWTRGATEAVNLIAQTYARNALQPGDEILVSEMEHHANIVPWQIVAEQTGAKVVKIPMLADCTLDMQAFSTLLSNKCKIVAVAHISNVTATRNPIEQMIQQAKAVGAITVIDGAQGIVHEAVNVAELDADFYLFSGHKIYAPTGIGVLYGKEELLEKMPPWHGGGKMVERVSFAETTFSQLPGKFEAGTPNIAGAIALESAINWLSQFDQKEVESHIHSMQQYAFDKLSAIEDVKIIGFQKDSSVLSFVIDGVHHQDIDTLLNQQNIAVRSGHHCAHPFMDALNIKGTVRVSFAIYNTMQDVDKLVQAVEKAMDIL